MNIRNATIKDLDAIYILENKCFSEKEAASKIVFFKRLQTFPNHFWILEDKDKLVGYINGMVTDNEVIKDEMFENAELHKEDGNWQSIFGLGIDPEYRRKGNAGILVNNLINLARKQNKKGVMLTCKEYLIPYYQKFGFHNGGLSCSVLGGEIWYDMRIAFVL